MLQWEYLVAHQGINLNELGSEGWELVGVVMEPERLEPTFYFKRPAPSFRDRVTLDQKRRYYAMLGIPLAEEGAA